MLRASLRSFLAHKGRMLLSALAVLLSVAFIVGSVIFSDTVQHTFDRLFASTAYDVSISAATGASENPAAPSGTVTTVPAELSEAAARVPGVRSARPQVTVENLTLVGEDNERLGSTTGAPTIGLGWSGDERSPVELAQGRLPRGPSEILVDKDTAERQGVGVGDRLRVLAAPGAFPARVVGIAAFTTTNPGATLVFLDAREASARLLGEDGAATEIAVRAEDGVGDAALKRQLAAELGAGYTYETAEEQSESAAAELGTFLDIIRYVMLGFAGVAVLVGIFLIVNTFSMLIAQRTRELGLLRALGAERRQVRRSVLTEALLLGLVGATLGLGAGVALAYGLIRLMSLLGMYLDPAQMQVGPLAVVGAYTVGIAVTVGAAALPARRAGQVSPIAALSDTEVSEVGRPLRTRAIVGAVSGGAGALALAACAASGETARAAVFLVAGIALTLLALVVGGPLLVRPLIRLLGAAFPRLYGPVGTLGQRNALRNPRRTGATAAALMVGLALVTGMSVAGASITKSTDKEIDRTLGADFTVQSDTFQPFPREVTERVRQVEGVGTVVRQRLVPVELAPARGGPVRSVGVAADAALPAVSTVEVRRGSVADALAPGAVGLDAEFARARGIAVGDTVAVRFLSGQRAELRVGALSTSGISAPGTEGGVLLGMRTLERYQPGSQDIAVLVNAAKGTPTAQLRERLEGKLEAFPQVQVRDQADYKQLVRDQIAVLLYLVYALLGLAIVIAVLGVVNTLALAVVERTRELGLLRAIGLSRVQLRRMIRLESVVIAVFGAVLGLGLGLVWGVSLHQLLALEGFTEFAVPWPILAAVLVGSLLVGLLAALLPALRASRMNVLDAIAHE